MGRHCSFYAHQSPLHFEPQARMEYFAGVHNCYMGLQGNLKKTTRENVTTSISLSESLPAAHSCMWLQIDSITTCKGPYCIFQVLPVHLHVPIKAFHKTVFRVRAYTDDLQCTMPCIHYLPSHVEHTAQGWDAPETPTLTGWQEIYMNLRHFATVFAKMYVQCCDFSYYEVSMFM